MSEVLAFKSSFENLYLFRPTMSGNNNKERRTKRNKQNTKL